MDADFKGCGCRVPRLELAEKSIGDQTQDVLRCVNLGCGAEWRRVGKSYQQIKEPSDPSRKGALKKPEVKPVEEAPAEPETKPEPLKSAFALITERLKANSDPDAAGLIEKLASRVLGTEESTAGIVEEKELESAPELVSFDDIVWPTVLTLRLQSEHVKSWGDAALRMRKAGERFSAWVSTGATSGEDGLRLLAAIAAEAQTAAEYLGLVSEDCVDAEEDAEKAD